MRVLITGEALENRASAVEQYTRQLIGAIVQRGDVELTALVPCARAAAALPEACRRIIHRPLKGNFVPAYWAFAPKGLNRFDLIHCATVRTPFLRKPEGTKLTMMVHDLSPPLLPGRQKPPDRSYITNVLPYLARQCDALIVPSKAVQQEVLSLLDLPDHRVPVVPPAARWELSAAPAMDGKGAYLLAVGTLEPRKNLPRVLRAFAEVRKRFPEIPDRLCIVGRRGVGDGLVESLLRYRRDISWLGFVPEDELKELYCNAKALIYPPLYEGFGLPVLEAMSLGCPVITSCRGSLPEIAGQAALFVDPEDIGQISRAIELILTQPELRRRLAERGLQQVARFSWQRCAADTVAVYRRLLAEPDTPSAPVQYDGPGIAAPVSREG